MAASKKTSKSGTQPKPDDRISILAKKAAEWVVSEEGKKTLKESSDRADIEAAEFRKAREIDYAALHTPFNV